MDTCRIIVHALIIISGLLLVKAWKCDTLTCIINPISLKLWYRRVEVGASTVRVPRGTDISITCDGACVGTAVDPHLRWYGTDRHWIAFEGIHNRVHVEKSISRRYLKLSISDISSHDSGEYICRGWLGNSRGWNVKKIKVIVENTPTTTITVPSTTTTTTTTTTTIKTTTPTTTKTTTTTVPTTETTAATTTDTEPTTLTIEPSNTTMSNVCPENTLPCRAGGCYDRAAACNGFPDCLDDTDEENCSSTTCNEGEQACGDGSRCIQSSYICDGTYDCDDGSDEYDC